MRMQARKAQGFDTSARTVGGMPAKASTSSARTEKAEVCERSKPPQKTEGQKPYSVAARLNVSTTGRLNTSLNPHHPAPNANNAPATAPTTGTNGEAFQEN